MSICRKQFQTTSQKDRVSCDFYKAYLKRAGEREEAKGCHQGSEELISETVLKQYKQV